jgi:hypothetical protein
MPRSNGGNRDRSIQLTRPIQPIPIPIVIPIPIATPTPNPIHMTQDSRNQSGHAVNSRSSQQNDWFDEQSLDVNPVYDAFDDMFMSFNDEFDSPFQVRHD